jgi:hypothetical protein
MIQKSFANGWDEFNLYHGVHVCPARLASPAALPEIAPMAPPLALMHLPGVAGAEMF